MPQAPLDVNWEAVRAHAVTHGIRPTAEHYGIAPGTLFARSSREGWLKPADPAPVPATMQPKASMACKPVQAAVNALATHDGRSRIGLAKAISKTATHLGRQKPEKLLHLSGVVKDTASAAKTVFDWGSSQAPSLVLNLGVAAPAAAPADPLEMLRSCAIPEQ